jgi:hypothetical protein
LQWGLSVGSAASPASCAGEASALPNVATRRQIRSIVGLRDLLDAPSLPDPSFDTTGWKSARKMQRRGILNLSEQSPCHVVQSRSRESK